MLIRELKEQREKEILSQWAAFSANTKGREYPIEPCNIRTCYQRDRDKIIHSKPFRRLTNKTQVFLSPEGDHYRTRLTHTIEVSQIARTIASALKLNEDLTEAAALGHDLGHTPFGHAGERALATVCPLGFKHNEQSVRIVEKLEKGGLNLTFEVRDAILNHTGTALAETLEGRILKFADRIAYINHDIDDAIRAKVLDDSDLPHDITDILGKSHSDRIDTLIHSVILESMDKNEIIMTDEIYDAMMKLRTFMFENVYRNPKAKSEEQKAEDMIKALYEYFCKKTEKLPLEYKETLDFEEKERVVCDYIAGMTDRYAVSIYGNIFVPKSFQII